MVGPDFYIIKELKKNTVLCIVSYLLQASAQLKTAAPGEGVVEPEPPQNVEGQQYVENKSYLTLEITLARPMVG